ncbi:hypothetical protein CA984_09450 [Streptosporangium minutum]|uniref:Uncharacterized protein n=1 Tax=Streptosporangium minutum TaxID=569862 RepID=A0A243RTZ5_9ACTN|nr:hypothetical protein CA984_09450 [Streptosporangium minutum]
MNAYSPDAPFQDDAVRGETVGRCGQLDGVPGEPLCLERYCPQIRPERQPNLGERHLAVGQPTA